MASGGFDITQLLLSASGTDQITRAQAEQQLVAAQEANYPQFLAALAGEVSNAAKPPVARQLAGLVLKNALDAKDDVRKAELQVGLCLVRQGVRVASVGAPAPGMLCARRSCRPV